MLGREGGEVGLMILLGREGGEVGLNDIAGS